MRYCSSVVTWEIIGRRLRQARVAAHLDLDALAAAAAVDASVLAALEAGQEARVSTAALTRIAIRLDVPVTALWSQEPTAEVEFSLRFRHASARDFFHEDEVVAHKAVLTARALDELDKLLDRQTLRSWFHERAVGSPAYEDGYARAREVRRVLAAKGAIDGEAAPLPDDLERAVEDVLGIPVVEHRLRTASVLAFTAKDRPTAAVAIVINTGAVWAANPLRRRVDLAHELAHALFDEPDDSLTLFINRKEDVEKGASSPSLPASDDDPVEQRARAFAAELLVPRLGLCGLFGPPPSVERSAEKAVEMVRRARDYFRSTVELTAHHLANNGYFPEHLHETVVRAAPPPVAAGLPSREPVLERRTREAVERSLLSAMAAREVLGLSVWDRLPWSDA